MTLLEKQAAMRARQKKCTGCGVTKRVDKFKLKKDRPAQPYRRKSKCADCDGKRQRFNRRHWLDAYWRANPCVDCGEADIDVLEFDHRDPEQKLGLVTRMTSAVLMAAEATKCDVRCANCHRRRHARERRLNALRKANLVLSNN